MVSLLLCSSKDQASLNLYNQLIIKDGWLNPIKMYYGTVYKHSKCDVHILLIDNLNHIFADNIDLIHEKEMIVDFEKHNPSIKVPSDLTNWVIRLELDKHNMILKNMDLETIIFALMREFPHVHIVYSHENSPAIIIRCYLRNTMFKRGQMIKQDHVVDIKNKIIT